MAESQENKNIFKVELRGAINETMVFPVIENEVREVHVDFSKTTSINSVGVHLWIKWLDSLSTKDLVLILQKCPVFIVKQMNFISSFLNKKTKVQSFYVPYYCESCNIESFYLFQRDDNFFWKNSTVRFKFPDEVKCNKCGELLEEDILEQNYFNFLKK